MNLIIVLCTVPDKICAQQISQKALNAKLAACVTILPKVISYYIWDNKLKKDKEVQMLLKSNIDHQQKLITLIKQNHPYKIPEILTIPIHNADNDYTSWLLKSMR
ncbi:MAG: divalent cation tolerance protein CutA [Pantoea sp. Brub]|nr:divalent cation tolerance protein CutA [Pantoea sp. Brub]